MLVVHRSGNGEKLILHPKKNILYADTASQGSRFIS